MIDDFFRTRLDPMIVLRHPLAVAHPTDRKLLEKARRLVTQTASRKALDNRAKLYSWHAPEVECISKGKSRNPYEFGVKVGLAMTLKGNLIVGALSFPGTPYDGHTMHERVEQSAILMQGLGVKREVVYADLGYRGVDKDNPGIGIKYRGKDRRLTDAERRLLTRRQAIEPISGHLKADHRMDRCHLKFSEGNALHAVQCSAVRSGLQHPLAAADDLQEMPGLLVVPVAGGRFGGLD